MSDDIHEARKRFQAATNSAAADRAAKSALPPQKAVPKPGARAKAGAGRWATHNAFVDVIAPHLTLAERAIWHVMFRHTLNGTCETTARLLASATNVSISTAQLALSRLHRAGLVWPIWKSKDRSKASKYGIHPNPADCLPRVIQQDEPCR